MRRKLDIARSIRIAAASKGLYLTEVAEKIGISRQQLHNILTQNDTTIKRVEEIARALKYDVFAFINLANADIGKLLVDAENIQPEWEVPHWVNKDAWQDFEAHRKEIRKPLTDRARRAAARILKGVSMEDQQAAIDLSIASRWAGIFPEKIRRGNEAHKQSAASRNARAVERFEKAFDEANGAIMAQDGVNLRAPLD